MLLGFGNFEVVDLEFVEIDFVCWYFVVYLGGKDVVFFVCWLVVGDVYCVVVFGYLGK